MRLNIHGSTRLSPTASLLFAQANDHSKKPRPMNLGYLSDLYGRSYVTIISLGRFALTELPPAYCILIYKLLGSVGQEILTVTPIDGAVPLQHYSFMTIS
jgi:hypothetical protein